MTDDDIMQMVLSENDAPLHQNIDGEYLTQLTLQCVPMFKTEAERSFAILQQDLIAPYYCSVMELGWITVHFNKQNIIEVVTLYTTEDEGSEITNEFNVNEEYINNGVWSLSDTIGDLTFDFNVANGLINSGVKDI